MAEALLEGVLGSLTSLAEAELGPFLGFSEEKEKLESMFTAIKAALEDAEEKQFSDKSTKDWMGKMKDAAYELDDILDECVYEQLRLEQEEVRCCVSKMVLSSSFSSFHPMNIYFRYKIAKRMKILSERLDRIASEKDQLRLNFTVQEETRGVPKWRQTFSLVTEPKVYGREDDVKKIVVFLAGAASRAENLPVYPIVGQGGLGKTTLAKLIFNHNDLKDFQLRIWVCVSEDFGLERMLKAIIQAASNKEVCKDLGPEPMQRRLRNLLTGKRYLLVLDDVWDVVGQNWENNWQMLRSVLDCGEKGASVLVTTRFSNVAEIMGTVKHPHRLSELSVDYCWELFKDQAFGADEVEPEELEMIGREIVKKCGGVPLAANAIGGLLRFHRNKDKWLNIMRSNLLTLSPNEKSIMPVLRLSYLNLPIELRQCFAYCAIFPKDERIEKQYLIELWMANGFISSYGRLGAEDVGHDVWNELYRRSFFQDIETDEFGKVTSFKMHDLVHDLAQFVAEEVCCITDDNVAPVFFERKRIHHLSDYRWWIHSTQLHQVKSLRTYVDSRTTDELSYDVLRCYSLRVLHLSRWKELSSSIGDLKHLRYLNLSYGDFKSLPESLCKLLNLQILKLDYCYSLQRLPNSLVRLKALQELSLKNCRSLSRLPPYIGKLTSLRSLSIFFVGKERGFLLAELGQLKLKRNLDIKHLEKVKSGNDAKEINMSIKQLNKLTLTWGRFREGKLEGNDEEVLEALEPCTETLLSLRVEGYQGSRFPEWMSSPSFRYLTYLVLWSCRNCVQLPLLAKLPSLKRLNIVWAEYVKYLHEPSCDDDAAFMALEFLSLCRLPSLLRLSSEDGKNLFPCLTTLEIDDCCNLLAEEVWLQGLQSLKKLKAKMCPKLNVWAGLQCLTCLEDLTIERCEEVEGLQHMTALKKLTLRDVPNIQSLLHELRFGELPLLRELRIGECYKLMCLPTSLRLSSVEMLSIMGCNPELKKRCEKETGEDWPIIAHIPRVYTH
ncbi:disease resistance protein RGA2-like [Vigna unguiculata]|uniref:disease resistance protein RGA2-like n=1 Tax=Vigna unguiculata TaxID=3917 RepID=UPI001016DB5A|nr:disease resistance protein RGA2-like [Vigna unguiculata]